MADVHANTTRIAVCRHCNQLLSRPDIEIRASVIPDTLGCHGLGPSQAVVVEETVTATLADIAELDQEISRLQAALVELQCKRASLQSFANAHQSLLNPITRLPTEVLSRIFQQCIIVCWLDKTDVPYRYERFDDTPLKIAAVCRHWRNIALSTPRLWVAMTFMLRPKDIKRQIKLAQMWISRSGNAPLSIHLSSYANYRDPMRKFMVLIGSTSGRWRHFYCKISLPMLQCISSIKQRLPLLETLMFNFWEEDDKALTTPIDIFAQAPRLRTLRAGRDINHLSITLPWKQLRTIIHRFREYPAQNLRDLLALASDVEYYDLHLGEMTGSMAVSSSHSPATVQLENLRSFAVSFRGSDPVSFFKAVHMPGIQSLSLATTKNVSWDIMTPCLVSICSQSSLEKLALNTQLSIYDSGDSLPSQHAVQILKAAKRLRHLEVPESGMSFMSAEFMEIFGQLDPSGTPTLGPNMETLLFCQHNNIDYELVAQALLSRCLPGRPSILKTITILCFQTQTLKVIMDKWQGLPCWGQLQSVGIEVQVREWNTYESWW
ncbi:hypothetical protein HWV62_24205 [Athelia sp. TMB]|nr:hypothetical protein HWV62_24205 [Athelia sp. TMB]